MKGVVLAGGLGTRLYPVTEVVNKHLIPVFNKPMIFYPLEMLAEAGIDEVLLIVGGKSTDDFLHLLKDGKRFGLKSLYYAFQEGEGGIAAALQLAESFAAGEKICVVLGDNLLEKSIRPFVEMFEKASPEDGAMVLLKSVPDPEHYGCPRLRGSRIAEIIEKPTEADMHVEGFAMASAAVIGVYFYDRSVFYRIKQCNPSHRGELEITDVNNSYAEVGMLSHYWVEGWWGDAGASFEHLHEVGQLVKESEKKVEYTAT